jgi:hypothetical protein
MSTGAVMAGLAVARLTATGTTVSVSIIPMVDGCLPTYSMMKHLEEGGLATTTAQPCNRGLDRQQNQTLVDELQRHAERHGLIAEPGQDLIQWVISEAFRPARAGEAP